MYLYIESLTQGKSALVAIRNMIIYKQMTCHL